jgi:hypothetical protein
MLKNVFFSLLLFFLLMCTESVYAWGICIINQTNKIIFNATEQTVNIVSNLPGDGEHTISNKGGYRCTKKYQEKLG